MFFLTQTQRANYTHVYSIISNLKYQLIHSLLSFVFSLALAATIKNEQTLLDI